MYTEGRNKLGVATDTGHVVKDSSYGMPIVADQFSGTADMGRQLLLTNSQGQQYGALIVANYIVWYIVRDSSYGALNIANQFVTL